MADVVPLNERQRKLVEDRVGLARAIGHRKWQQLAGYERDEIISYATLGLVSAAFRWEDYCREKNYEPYEGDAGSWFDTYASRRINGSIIDALRSSDPATRRERALIKQIIAAGVDLSSSWEHESVESIAARAKLPVEDVRRAISALVRMPVALEETTEDVWPADPVDVEQEALEARLCACVVREIKRFSEMHQLIFFLAYYQELTDEEILDRIPELKYEIEIGPHGLAWVSYFREQVAVRITSVLRRELAPQR